ncbi:hypothetical protein I4U23_023718 [Adineta vaga]|nr:hypothetical protein I4U23_023718 [Adineta vaga]
MLHDTDSASYTFKFSQCILLEQSATTLKNTVTTQCRQNEKKEVGLRLAPSLNVLEQTIHDMDLYERKLATFCGLWADYPCQHYQMEFRIEMGQLIGYSNVYGSKALASFDGNLINMIIIHPKEAERSIDHYRGRLGWNKKYIIWEKEDSSRQTGWRSTRRWIRLE